MPFQSLKPVTVYRFGSPGVTQRYFTRLNASSAQYYQFSSDIVLSGDFEVECVFSTDATTGARTFFGGPSNFVRIGGVNYQFMINSNYTSTTAMATTDGTLSLLNFRRVGSTGDITDNGVVVDTRTVSTDPFTIGFVGSRGPSGNYFDGYIADFKVWSGGDKNSGTLVCDCKIDTDLSTPTIPNDANPLNPLTAINLTSADAELFTLNTSTTPDQWENSDQSVILPIGY